MKRVPLNWRPDADGAYFADCLMPVAGEPFRTERFVLAPLFVRRWSESAKEFVGEADVAWTVTWRDEEVFVNRYDVWLGDEYESTLFTLGGAMRAAEMFRFETERDAERFPRLRWLLGLRRLSTSRFKDWLRSSYPTARTGTAGWAAEQYERIADAEALARFRLEGREPTQVIVD